MAAFLRGGVSLPHNFLKSPVRRAACWPPGGLTTLAKDSRMTKNSWVPWQSLLTYSLADTLDASRLALQKANRLACHFGRQSPANPMKASERKMWA